MESDVCSRRVFFALLLCYDDSIQGIRKVAIVDFDVHHGNGTEEIVRWLVPGVDETSIDSPFTYGVIKTPRFKPWLDVDDANNVLFVSVHGYGPRAKNVPAISGYFFYPGSGETQFPSDELLAGKQEQIMDEGSESDNNDSSNTSNEQSATAAAAADNGDQSGNSSDDDSDYQAGMGDDDDDDADSDDDIVSVNAHRMFQRRQSPMERMVTLDQVYSNDGDTLILDVGVSLPGEEEDTLPGSYRKQWRDGFRFRILPMCVPLAPRH
jgi:hypothetical protein